MVKHIARGQSEKFRKGTHVMCFILEGSVFIQNDHDDITDLVTSDKIREVWDIYLCVFLYMGLISSNLRCVQHNSQHLKCLKCHLKLKARDIHLTYSLTFNIRWNFFHHYFLILNDKEKLFLQLIYAGLSPVTPIMLLIPKFLQMWFSSEFWYKKH